MKYQNLRPLLELLILLFDSLIGSAVAKPLEKEYSDDLLNSSNLEQTTKYWMDKAQNVLAIKLKQSAKPNTNRAKNIILFLGDGMSVHTITATRKFLGGGDSAQQVSFDRFPYTGLSKTYAIDMRVADSASTATAYLCGVKANYGTIGVNAKVRFGDCYTAANDTSTHTASLAKWAQDAGKWAGLVTTARVTHASPAGVYAHTANRKWEHDAAIKKSDCDPSINMDIAQQLVHGSVGRKLRVVLGGGRKNFRDRKTKDEQGKNGKRTDKRDLIKEWLKSKSKASSSYVWSKKSLDEVNIEKTEYLLGLFCASHCPYHGELKRRRYEQNIPSLSEMTEKAIRILSKNKAGYFLFVEGARIDMAHHQNMARRSLEDTAEFARAVELARNLSSSGDTLIVVTSDHSHTMSINGYPNRKDNIFGLAPGKGLDGLPYTILSYANGPGYYNTYSSETGRLDLSKDDLENPKYKYMATVPLNSETHGGEDVGVYASGPYEHYFTGNYEQSTIPALIAYAANIAPFQMEDLMKDIK